jgi:hypothetical protein
MTNDQDLTADLNDAIADLQDALDRAAEAGARIRRLMPRVGQMSAVFGELESIFANSRAPAAEYDTAPPPRIAPERPTLVVTPSSPKRGKKPSQAEAVAEPEPDAAPAGDVAAPDAWAPSEAMAYGEPTMTVRLEVSSQGGPLDLRAVDDLVTQHPAVRDVALLDYDGRRATLKVWIAASVSAAEVQRALDEQAHLIGEGSDVSIIALEDVA